MAASQKGDGKIMNVFVTGGAGYIGSITIKKLLDQGHRVTVLDILENGHRPAVDARAIFIEGDLKNVDLLKSTLSGKGFDAVIHFAGYIESGQSMKNPFKFFENNFCNGLKMAGVLNESGLKNIIFSSTAGVYGTGKPPFSEESPINTTSYYSMSKYFFEEALKSAQRAYGFKVVVLRYFNAAGALMDGSLGEAHEPETHLIPNVIKTVLGLQSEISLYGTDYPTPDGTAVRDYIHVEDLAQAHILALSRFKDSGSFFQVYNVGTGSGYSNRQIINKVKEVSGNDFRVVEKARREGDWDESFANSQKIQEDLGWRAKYGLQEIIESAYLWHKNHPYGFS